MQKKWIGVALLAAIAGGASAQLYTTGFEAPTYTAGGSVNGVDGWANGSGSGTGQTVSTNRAFSGSQSLRYNIVAASTFSSVRHAFGTYSGVLDVSVKLWVDSTTSANRVFGLYLGSTSVSTLGGTVLGVTVAGDGKVRAAKEWLQTNTTTFQHQAAAGTFADRWLTLRLTYDTSSQVGTVDVSGFGGATSSFSTSFTGVTAPMDLNLGTDFVSGAPSGTAYFDDLVVTTSPVPEPATMAVLGLGLIGLRRRRKR